MILNLRVTEKQKEALLYRYPSIKYFLQKTLSDTADKLIVEKQIFNIDEELSEFSKRQALNAGVEWRPGTPYWKNRKHTQATKDKISKTLIEKYQNEEKFTPLPETCQRIGESNKGKIVSRETKDAISKANKGKKRTEQQRKNISLGHTGLKYKKRIKVSEEKVECVA